MLHARKTTPKVTRGRVRKKHRTALTEPAPRTPRIVRKPPRAGHRHVVTKGDLNRFLGLLPEWSHLLATVSSIVLAEGDRDVDASYAYADSRIAIQPWRTLTPSWHADHVSAHESILTRLGVPLDPTEDGVVCRFTRDTARAYMLLHVLMHELGHHRHYSHLGIHASQCEKHAEEFALAHESLLWRRYVESFGHPEA